MSIYHHPQYFWPPNFETPEGRIRFQKLPRHMFQRVKWIRKGHPNSLRYIRPYNNYMDNKGKPWRPKHYRH